jgi:hypothetical protein
LVTGAPCHRACGSTATKRALPTLMENENMIRGTMT